MIDTIGLARGATSLTSREPDLGIDIITMHDYVPQEIQKPLN